MRRPLLLIPLLLLAGCAGNNKSPGVATADGGATPTASASADAESRGDPLKFAQCMRDNGITNFKDPDPDEKGFSVHIEKGNSKEKVDAATKACKQYMPNGGEPSKPDPALTAKLRVYAKCMRENGITDFPDPGADGGIQLKNEPGGNLNPEGSAFKKADQACSQYRPEGPGGEAKRTEQG